MKTEITDDQIRALRDEATAAGDHEQARLCERALNPVALAFYGRQREILDTMTPWDGLWHEDERISVEQFERCCAARAACAEAIEDARAQR